VARKIKDMIEADLFKIEMRTPYAKDYNTCIAEAKEHQKQDARPELKSLPTSIDAYETVILGYPNYWGTMPMAVFTFLEAFDFSGKTILPLCTNEGSGMGSSESDIRKLCPGADVKRGLSINGSSANKADAQIKSWLKSNVLM
jgi:flavodoxin